LVFKIVADSHGELFYRRIYSGTLKTGSRVYNPGSLSQGRASSTVEPYAYNPAPDDLLQSLLHPEDDY